MNGRHHMMNIKQLRRKWLGSISRYNPNEEEYENAVKFVSYQDSDEAPPQYKSEMLQIESDAANFSTNTTVLTI